MSKITIDRSTVEQALEALEDAKALLNSKDSTTTMWFAHEITALRAALAEPDLTYKRIGCVQHDCEECQRRKETKL